MRARLVLGSAGGFAIAAVWFLACIPHPEADFEDYQERIKTFPKPVEPVVEAGPPIETGPPPTQAVEATYYAACLVELANGQKSKIFSFLTTTAFTPNPQGQPGGNLAITLEALALVDKKAPPTVSRAGLTGAPLPVITGATDAAGSFVAQLEPGKSASFPGAANPISGSDVVLVAGVDPVGLRGKFAEARFCARLTGHIQQPAAAERDLDVNNNFCVFVPIKDGDATPAIEPSAYSVESCPL